MADVRRRCEAEQHVDVAETEIGIKDPDTVAEARERNRQVHDDVRLADAALAAGDRDHRRAARAAANRGIDHATAPMRASSPITHAAMTAGVARCRSSGTLWPVPRNES